MYTLRPAEQTDLLPMMEIGHEGLRPYIEQIRGWNKQAEEAGFLAHFEPAKIKIIQFDVCDVGYFKIEGFDDHIYIDGIYIHSDFRSKGVGSQVISDLIASARKPLRLRVYKNNPAEKLYRKLGFDVVRSDELRFTMQYESGING